MQENIELTVADVTKNNLETIWPTMSHSIQSSTFIGIDLELSGLGDRKQLNASCVEDRYKALCNTARSRSIISIGLSCFKEVTCETDLKTNLYKVDTYNLLVLCDGEYAVESKSLQFLVSHGFNFNKQYSCGIPYTKGNCEEMEAVTPMRQLMKEVILAQKPIIVHNGFIDLIFMYQCFYADLPTTLQTFVADLCEIFKGGIIDTKYISEFHSREKLSVLEYLFRKCQHQNHYAQKNDEQFVRIDSTGLVDFRSLDDKEIIHCSLPSTETIHGLRKYIPLLCTTFELRGYCPVQMCCEKIHSFDLIIANEELSCMKKGKRRKRKRKQRVNTVDGSSKEKKYGVISDKELKLHNEEQMDDFVSGLSTKDNIVTDLIELKDEITKESYDNMLPRLDGHRAGFDAFMTAYCFACYKLKLDICNLYNKIYLTSKDVPLNIIKSHFAKTSAQHEKMMMIINENSCC